MGTDLLPCHDTGGHDERLRAELFVERRDGADDRGLGVLLGRVRVLLPERGLKVYPELYKVALVNFVQPELRLNETDRSTREQCRGTQPGVRRWPGGR